MMRRMVSGQLPLFPTPSTRALGRQRFVEAQLIFSDIGKIDGLLTAFLSISRNLKTPTTRASGRHQ